MVLLLVFTCTSMSRWQHDQLSLHKSMHWEQAGIKHSTLKGLDPRINPDKPPRNFRDAMKALGKQAWGEAQFGVSGIQVCRKRCIQSNETWAWNKNPRHNHKSDKTWIPGGQWCHYGDFLKVKACMYVRGDWANSWSQLQGNWSIRTCAQGGLSTIAAGTSSSNWR